jgi:hypothetical protein
VCWVTLADRSPAEALAFLRGAIRRYNVATGGENTVDAGYHETLTAYYVGTVAALGCADVGGVLTAGECARTGPLRYWSRARLFSGGARTRWCTPDLRPLPWDAGVLVSRRTTAPDRRRHA